VNLKGMKEPAIVSRERVSDFKKWIGWYGVNIF
jgi:hypothetical protein